MKDFKIKENTHIVIKVKDLKNISCEAQGRLHWILLEIMEYRKDSGKPYKNDYYVVNKDELYADKILEVIKQGELEKD
jgi:hypothetical protein